MRIPISSEHWIITNRRLLKAVLYDYLICIFCRMLSDRPLRTAYLQLGDSDVLKLYLFNKRGARQYQYSNCTVVYPHFQFDWNKKFEWNSPLAVSARAWGRQLLEWSGLTEDEISPRYVDNNLAAQSSILLCQIISKLSSTHLNTLSEDFIQQLFVPVADNRSRYEMFLLHAELVRNIMIEITGLHYWLENDADTIKSEVLAATVILMDTFCYTNVRIFQSRIEGMGLQSLRTISAGHILAVGIPLPSNNPETSLSDMLGVFGTIYCSNSSIGQRSRATVTVAEFRNVFTGCVIGEDGDLEVEERFPINKLLVMLSDKTLEKGVELTWFYDCLKH